MRNCLLTTILFAAIIFSCTKENTSNSNVDESTGTITCNVNGTHWQSLKDLSISYYQNLNRFDIIGRNENNTDSSGVILSLILTQAKNGIYDSESTDTLNPSLAFYYPDKKTKEDILKNYKTTFQVNLVKFDAPNHCVSGTFTITQKAPSGSGKPDFVITNGVFNKVMLVL